MHFTNIYFLFLLILTVGSYARGTELVPVYMWGTNKIGERSHALHRTSQESFKDTVLERLSKDPCILVFVENTLSPEDFAQHNEDGETAFTNLQNLRKFAVYKPYVQSPLEAIRQLNKETRELSIATYLAEKPDVPKDNVLIIYLNDAKEDEHRFDLLRRHDSFISSVYNDALEHYDNILAFYTAHHTSWVAPGETSKPKKRSLLANEEAPAAEDDPRKIFKTSFAFLYINNTGQYMTPSKNVSITNYTATSNQSAPSEEGAQNVTLTLQGLATEPTFQFYFHLDESGYWYLTNVTAQDGDQHINLTSKVAVVAPNGFSYNCFNVTFEMNETSLHLPGLQIQPFFFTNGTDNNTIFGDAYSCVGFTSIPIWSGLFVTAILLLIMTFGLTMMMDIKTMDRFDDAKGKTITINVSE